MWWEKKSASLGLPVLFPWDKLALHLSCEVNFQLTARQYRLTNYLKVAPLYPFQRLSCCHRQGSSAPSTAGTARCHSWYGTEGLAAFWYCLKEVASHIHFGMKTVAEKEHDGRSVKLIHNIIIYRKAKNIKNKKI